MIKVIIAALVIISTGAVRLAVVNTHKHPCDFLDEKGEEISTSLNDYEAITQWSGRMKDDDWDGSSQKWACEYESWHFLNRDK